MAFERKQSALAARRRKIGLARVGRYYSAGYCIECALKACIAKTTLRHDFPDKKKVDLSYTHNLRGLIDVARLEKALVEESKRDPTFRNYWDVVQSWTERSRYSATRAETAKKLIEAVGDRTHGILRWIELHW